MIKQVIQKNMFWIIFGITIAIWLYPEGKANWTLKRYIGWGWDPIMALSRYIPSFLLVYLF